ncbi:hypothetical protein BC939DRAFT_505361 [Gamsiella multidivaricata]|uniref:uncharacterized protein n=1 Tax=Gamsiella multidivaricata TaxID=101098 RepID=UPI00221FD9B3|nr:uncharacterized protein BC939DRAFT_505361 [Gamsiella multidivaricata]KAI7819908.1 hypothetical protein BC939DRAFT_505361 [Gamsiella multidivaricata]
MTCNLLVVYSAQPLQPRLTDSKLSRCNLDRDLFDNVGTTAYFDGSLQAQLEYHRLSYTWNDLNLIEETWGLTKRYVADINDGSDFDVVRFYLYEGLDKCDEVRRSTQKEERYIIQDRVCLDERPASPLEFEVTDSETEDEEDKGPAAADEDDYSLQVVKALSTSIGDSVASTTTTASQQALESSSTSKNDATGAPKVMWIMV